MLPYFSAYVTSKTALHPFLGNFEVKDGSGFAVFAMGPGTVPTAMSEYSLDWRRRPHLSRPGSAYVFDEGRDLQP